ncbi:MAG: transposase [Hydrogenophaga sp.]|nr:transposase [Hydrogenophaga sp.]
MAQTTVPAFKQAHYVLNLGVHIHLHAIMACGVLGQDPWHTPVRKPDYLFPTRALSKVWRAKFMQHVLPSGLKRIRHYGLLANPNGAKLAQARAALHMPAPNPPAQACAQDFMARVARVNIHQCPVCQQGRLGVVQTLARAKHLPDPFEGSTRKANSRAPPAQGP